MQYYIPGGRALSDELYTRLLTVLVVFYIIGAILKVILSCAFKAMEDRQKKAEAAEAKTDDSEVFDNDDDNDKPIS